MGTSVLLVFIIPLMVADMIGSWVSSLFGVDFDSVVSWFGSTEATDLGLTIFARIYDILESVAQPIIEMLAGII